MSTSMRFTWAGWALTAAAAALSTNAAVAATKSTAYYSPQGTGFSDAYLIDWQGKNRARVANPAGAQSGGVTSDGTQKVVTLDSPISFTYETGDDCGDGILQRQDTNQVVVRDLAGMVSQMVEIGTITNIGGCHDGLVTPFGNLDDPGTSMNRVAMTARPPVTDLVPGVQLAGYSEEIPPGIYDAMFTSDVATFQAGGLLKFQATGNVYSAAFDANQWLVINLQPGTQRAYTRLFVDSKTTGESWLMADWEGGQAARVRVALAVKPAAGAGFGNVADASRMWESGLFVATRKPFYFYLYKNGTGERVQKDLDLGTESRTPLASWGFDGLDLTTTRIIGGGAVEYDRRWTPLRNQGSKVHWVMEGETITDSTGTYWNIKPRVNYYLDTGKAVPPANASQAAGMVYLGSKPKLPR